MWPVAVFIILCVIAALLFMPARRLAERTILGPSRPDTRYAALVNLVLLAAIFAYVILVELGLAGIPAALAGIVVGGELGVMISYMLTRFIFGET